MSLASDVASYPPESRRVALSGPRPARRREHPYYTPPSSRRSLPRRSSPSRTIPLSVPFGVRRPVGRCRTVLSISLSRGLDVLVHLSMMSDPRLSVVGRFCSFEGFFEFAFCRRSSAASLLHSREMNSSLDLALTGQHFHAAPVAGRTSTTYTIARPSPSCAVGDDTFEFEHSPFEPAAPSRRRSSRCADVEQCPSDARRRSSMPTKGKCRTSGDVLPAARLT